MKRSIERATSRLHARAVSAAHTARAAHSQAAHTPHTRLTALAALTALVALTAVVALAAAGCIATGAAASRRDGAAPPPATTTRAAVARTPKVLLIGIDGVRPDVLRDVPTPKLDALIAAGTFSDGAQTGLPTLSGPGWTSMLTGVWREKHGITSNQFPFPDHRLAEYPDFLTRIERVRPELNTFAVADWPPLASAEAGGPVVGEAVDVRIVLDGAKIGWAEADERSVRAAIEHLGTGDPDALFVYLGNPDEVSHHTGSIEDEYRAAISRADRHVGRLVEAIRSRLTYDREDWLILVSTDHGRRSDGRHGDDSPVERTIFYLASGPSAASGSPDQPPRIVDVAVTALTHLGIAIEPAWDLDGMAVGLAGARAR